MKAMVLNRPGEPLQMVDRPIPEPGPGQVLVRVAACGVCRTDLHLVDGELERPRLPVVPGHEIVGYVAATGRDAGPFEIGDRVGIPWLGSTCRCCRFCLSDRENLCDRPGFTGYTLDGGYAEYITASAHYCFALRTALSDVEAAPLLCAGLIGYRCLRYAGDAKRLGIYGFGAAAHIISQVAVEQGREVFAFTRPQDRAAPVGPLVPIALKAVEKGGTVVLGGIHMSEIPPMPYAILWGERRLQSVANLTRQDAREFLSITAEMSIKTHVEALPLSEANAALDRLRAGNVSGALVLIP